MAENKIIIKSETVTRSSTPQNRNTPPVNQNNNIKPVIEKAINAQLGKLVSSMQDGIVKAINKSQQSPQAKPNQESQSTFSKRDFKQAISEGLKEAFKSMPKSSTDKKVTVDIADVNIGKAIASEVGKVLDKFTSSFAIKGTPEDTKKNASAGNRDTLLKGILNAVSKSDAGEFANLTTEISKMSSAVDSLSSTVIKLEKVKGGGTSDLKNIEKLLSDLVSKRLEINSINKSIEKSSKTSGLSEPDIKALTGKLDELKKEVIKNSTSVVKVSGPKSDTLNLSSIVVKKLDKLITSYNTKEDVKVKIENPFSGKIKIDGVEQLVKLIERLDSNIAKATITGAPKEKIATLKKEVRSVGSDVGGLGEIKVNAKGLSTIKKFVESLNEDVKALAGSKIKLDAIVDLDTTTAEKSLQKLSKSKYKVDVSQDSLIDLYNKIEAIYTILDKKSKLSVDADLSGLTAAVKGAVKDANNLEGILNGINLALRSYDQTKGKLFAAVKSNPQLGINKKGQAYQASGDIDDRAKKMMVSYNRLAKAYDKDIQGKNDQGKYKYEDYKGRSDSGKDTFRRTSFTHDSSIKDMVKALKDTEGNIKSLFASTTGSNQAESKRRESLNLFNTLQKRLDNLDTDKVQQALDDLANQSQKNANELTNIFSSVSAKAFKDSEKAAKVLADSQNNQAIALDKKTAVINESIRKDKVRLKSSPTDPGFLSSHKATLIGPTRYGLGGKAGSAIKPTKEYIGDISTKLSKGMDNKYEKQVYARAQKLALSLEKLQKNIYDRISKGLDKSAKENQYQDKWGVVGDSPAGAFKLRGRQWGMDVANVSKLQSLTGKQQGSTKQLMSEYKSKLSKEMFGAGGTKEVTEHVDINTKKISDWVNSNLDLSNINTDVGQALGKGLLSAISKNIGNTSAIEKVVKEHVNKSNIADIFGATVGAGDVSKEVAGSGVLKTISLPAAKVSSSGNTTLETQYGRQRSLAQYSDYKTGYERAFDVYFEQNKQYLGNKKAETGIAGMARSVKRMSIGDAPYEKSQIIAPGKNMVTASNRSVSKTLIASLAGEGKQGFNIDDVKGIYEQALIPISIEKQRITGGTDKPLDAQKIYKSLSSKLSKAVSTSKEEAPGDTLKQLDLVMDKMDELGIKGTRVLKSLNTIDFSNFYDILDVAVSSKLDAITANINTSEKGIRNYEKAITQLETLMPLVEGNAPRRAMHQGNVVNTLSKTSKAYNINEYLKDEDVKNKFLDDSAKYDDPDTSDVEYQKTMIRDFNKTYRNLFYESSQLSQFKTPAAQKRRQQLNTGTAQGLSSLGLPESTAGSISSFNKGEIGEQPDAIRGTVVPMYAGELRGLAPFGKGFQQTGRNISNVTAAKSFDPSAVPGVKSSLQSQFPTLRSKQEQDVIQSGRYGTSGYGYNVTAELSHTAGTFEDQILVSGKLAEAITSLTKKLIKPGAGPSATSMKEGLDKGGSRLLTTTDSSIEDVSREIMKVMGVSDKYKGRADEVLLKDVNDTITTVRGEDVEVQTAKIAEAFMNHFGRKFTTRYGSKGVSMSPGDPKNMASILSKYEGDFPSIKVLAKKDKESAGLGVAMMPKSAGEMLSEMFSKELGTALNKEVMESGNKFVLEIFKNASKGLVTESEAKKNIDTLVKLQSISKRAVGGLDMSSFESIKSAYTEKTGQSAFKATPIDIRISSLGAGKRGLQGEVLEMVTGNLSGVQGGSTVLKDDPEFESLLGEKGKKGTLSQASFGLGYSGSGKSSAEIRKAIAKMYGGSIEGKEKLVDSLVQLEDKSSFYVDVIDEFGKKRKSLVGKKFVQIIEEAKQFEEWSKGSIDSGAKGLKLNIPAYAAYTSVFGKDSEIMKQIDVSFDEKQGEAHEKIVAYLVNTNASFKEKTLKNLKSIDLKDIGSFEGAFGSLEEGPDTKNSMSKTIFNTDELSSSFKIPIYSGSKSKEGTSLKEDLYVPKSILRASFDDPMVAGGRGVSASARDLQDVINKARSLQAYEEEDTSMLLGTDKGVIERTFGGKLHTNLQRQTGVDGIDKLRKLVKIAEEKATDTTGVLSVANEKAFKNAYPDKQGQVTQKEFATYLSSLSNLELSSDTGKKNLKELLVGANKKTSQSILGTTNKDDRFELIENMSKAAGIGFKSLGAKDEEGYQGLLSRKRTALKESKDRYSTSLQKDLLGKKGAVAQTLFTRKVPAVLAKATQATVDKTDDLSKFTATLASIESEFKSVMQESSIKSFSVDIKNIEGITADHSKNLEKLRAMGMPVLKQHELGVPEKLAATLSMDFTKAFDVKTGKRTSEPKEVSGTLNDLLKYIEKLKEVSGKGTNTEEINKYIDKELSPYIESVRFPFTGTSSLQPYKATLTKTRKGINQDTLMVPGVPEMDMDAFDKVYSNIKEKRDQAVEKREGLRITGTDQSNRKAELLTSYIDKLNKAISDVLPKYVAQAQKLDFDGDQIEIHTATTKAAREDIRKHFDLLTNDVDSTAGRFRDAFTYDAKQPSQGDVPLAFMGKAFSKKFGPEKGFDYLKQPFMTEDLEYLNTSKKIEIIASKKVEEGKSDIEAVTSVVNAAIMKSGTGSKDLLDKSSFVGIKSLEDAAAAAAVKIKEMPNMSIIQGYLKESLSDAKWADAVNAQLFKIHTGKEVEGLTKLMRAYEGPMGFGGGETSLKGTSKDIDKDFLLRERQTQMNELYRFSVQKGMDVKHAGEATVASDVMNLTTLGPKRVEDLIGRIKTDDNFSGLKDFMDENTKSLENRFGRYTTEDLKSKATKELDMSGLENLSRGDLISKLTDKLGFTGFLRELQQEIEKQALESLAETKDKKGNLLGKRGAEAKLKQDYDDGKPINVGELVTNKFDPLYQLRTSSAEAKLTSKDDFSNEFIKMLESVSTDDRKGTYSEMTKGFKRILETNERKYSDVNSLELLSRLNTTTFEKGGDYKGTFNDISRELDRLESVVGVAPMTEFGKEKIRSSEEVESFVSGTNLDSWPADIKGDDNRTKYVEEKKKEFRAYAEDAAILRERTARINKVKDTPSMFDLGGVVPEVISTREDKERIFKSERPLVSKDREVRTADTGDMLGIFKDKGALPPSSNVVDLGKPGPLDVIIKGIETGDIMSVAVISTQVKAAMQTAAPFSTGDDVPLYFKSEGAESTRSSKSEIEDYHIKTQKQADEARIKRAAEESYTLSPYAGFGPESQLKNIELLRGSALMTQPGGKKGFEDSLERMPESVKDMIGKTKVGDVTPSKFFEFLDNKQIEDIGKEDPELDPAKISQAWKLFKDARIEFLISKAKEAERFFQETKELEDENQIKLAYEGFNTAVETVQAQIKSDAGKRSDIYTQNNTWNQPGIAKAAGVYMTPREVRLKASKGLDYNKKGDIELAKVFEELTKDLSGESRGTMKSPIEKSRYAVSALTDMNTESAKLMESGALLERLGPEIAEAWDFKGGVQSITRLREMLELFKQYNVSETPLSVERKNIDSTIKMLKDAENKMSYLDLNKQTNKAGAGEWGSTGVLPIPKWMDAKTQDQMNKRNIVKIQDYMKRPETEGGAKVGEKYIYNEKVFDQAGEALKNNQQIFTKYKEVIDATGATVGKFANKQNDLIDAMSGANRGFTGAIKRAVMWGAASTVVYGGFSQLKESIGVLADIEIQVASLRMVMNPLTTDFESMSEAAVGMAKKYGTGVGDVLSGMKVYAQQGLSEPQILDRAETSTLAANVTTLDAKDATEALTAAMKIFRKEGESSMAFLDSWSEVESKHAITAGDLADAIKKAASAASTAGISFHELNGIVATIGSTTRQSGKEVGTSMRFIMRRLSSEKGPAELGKMGISTVTGGGDLRGGFDVLGDLAGKWDDLTGAQKMNVAQAIGGTRQYNSLIVLMDHWDQALEATKDSQNSKGAAERKNIEIMKTYAKQLEQTKAAMVELQMSVGKAAFPLFKGGLKVVKTITEALSNIPAPIKAAGAAAVVLFTYLAKGADIIKSIGDFFSSGTPAMGGLLGSIKDELKTASFEILGAGSGDFTKGLKTVTKDSNKDLKQGIQLSDFHSALGKSAHLIYSAGLAFNSAVGTGLKGASKVGDVTGGGMKSTGNFLSILSSMSIGKEAIGAKLKGKDTTMRDVGERAVGLGVTAKAAKEAFGAKAFGKLAGAGVALAGEVAGLGTTAAGLFVESFSEKLGSGGDLFKKWAGNNAGFIEAIAPMALTFTAMAPAVKELGSQFAKTTRSSQDFENSMYGIRRASEGSLKTIRDSESAYAKLVKGYNKLKENQTPSRVDERKRLGTYKSPVLEMAQKNKEATKFANELASTNASLVAGYDNLGNAVLRASKNFDNLFNTLKKSKIKEMAGTEVSIAAKHIQSLTQVDGAEKWKYELKQLTKEVPVFGDLISNQIKVSPAKQMKEVTKKLNVMTAKKGQYSLTTAFDDDIKSLQERLAKVRSGFNETYSDFKNTLSNIQFDGLSPQEISKILGDEDLRAGYKLMLDVEPEYNLKGIKNKIKWEDVLGAEIMKRSFAETGGSMFGATKELTSANIESAGIEQRQGKLLSGDLVTFTGDAAKKFDMAGSQAIIQMKETSDGIFNWVATYFNTKTLKVEERIFDSSMQNLVEAILPTRVIEKDLSDRIEALNEFTAGAGAGLRGISAKDFKRDFGLGERFFSDIASSSIIQGEKGYTPTTGFGESPFQKGWGDDFEKYYAKPVEQYRFLLEKLQKMNMAGVGSDQVKMTTELYDELSELQNILKNNQVIMQYRAAFADLTKTLEANTRATAENLAVAGSRLSLTKETSGLMKGKNKDLSNLDLGIRDKSKLTAQQRLLISNPDFESKAKQLSALEIKRTGAAEGIYAADKTQVALDSIKAVSKGFGSAMSADEMKKYTETVAKTGDLGVAELKIDTAKTADNTAATVERLDQLLERFDKQDDASDMSSSIRDFVGMPNGILDGIFTGLTNPSETERISEALDRVADIRNKAASEGDSETLIKSSRALDLLVERLIDKKGLKGAAGAADRGIFGKGSFTSDELYSRAFAGMDIKTLMSEMGASMPDEKSWFGLVNKGGTPEFDAQTSSLYDLQEKNKSRAKESSILNSKNLAGVAASAAMYGAFSRDYTNKRIDAIDTDLTSLRQGAVDRGTATVVVDESGKSSITLQSDDDKSREKELLTLRSQEAKKSRLYGTVQAMAGTTAASTMLARNMGMSDNTAKMTGVMGSAVGAYGAAKLQTGMTKEDLPENFKKFQEDLFKYGEDAAGAGDGAMGKAKKSWAAFNLRGASKDLMKSIAEESMGLKEVKDTDKPKTYAENIKEGAEFTSKKISEVSDRIVSALEKNVDATNKNTDAKTGQETKEGKALGGSIQNFANGGIIGNTSTISPKTLPSGIPKQDNQLILGQIGELVIPKDKREEFERYQQIFDNIKNSGKKYADGGKIIIPQEYLENYGGGITEDLDFINKNKEFEETNKDARLIGNLAKFGLLGAGAGAAGAFALKGYKKAEGPGLKSKILAKKDLASDAIKNFSLKDSWGAMDKRIFANPFANLKDLPKDLKKLKGVQGKGFGAGAAAAGKLGMKSAGWMGAGLTLGFAANRLRKGDLSGAMLETASAALSGTLLGSVGALGIQAYLGKRDLGKSSDLKSRKQALEEKIAELAPKQSFASGGLVWLAKELGHLGLAGVKGAGKVTGSAGKLLAKGILSKELIADVVKVSSKSKEGTLKAVKYSKDKLSFDTRKLKTPEFAKAPLDLAGSYASNAKHKTLLAGKKALSYVFSENLLKGTKIGTGVASTLGKVGIGTASVLANIPATGLALLRQFPKLHMAVATGAMSYAAAMKLTGDDDFEGFASGGNVEEKDVSFFKEIAKGGLRNAGLGILGVGAAIAGAPLIAAGAGAAFLGNSIYSSYRGAKGLLGGTDKVQSTKSGVLGGYGTGTSDSNTMHAENGSFIIPSKHTPKAKRYLEGQTYANGGNIRVSKGEYFISPEDAARIGRENLEKLRYGQKPRFANGGSVGNITSSADQIDYNKVAQVAASATAATLARYVAEKDSQKVRAADLEGYAKSETREIGNILNDQADSAQAVYDKLNITSDLKDTKTTEKTEEVSKVLNSDNSFSKVSSDISTMRSELEGTFSDTTEEVMRLKDELAQLELEEQFNMQVEGIKKSIKDANFAEDVKKSLKIGKGIFEGIGAGQPGIDLGPMSRDGMDKYQLLKLKSDRKSNKDFRSKLKDGEHGFQNIGKTISNSLKNVFKSTKFWQEKGDRGLKGKKALNEYERLEGYKNNQISIIDASLNERAEATGLEGQKNADKKIKEAEKQIEKIVRAQASWGDDVEIQALKVAKSFAMLTSASQLAADLIASRSADQFNLQNAGAGGQLKGAVSGLQLIPNSFKTMSQDQYDWKTAPKEMKNRMQAFQDATKMYGNEQIKNEQFKRERVKVQTAYDQAPDKSVLGGILDYKESSAQKVLNNQIKSLNESILESDAKLKTWSEGLAKSSRVIYTFKAISSALLEFENAIQASKEAAADTRLGGQAADNALSRMYGGSSPFAPQFVDPYQQSKAADVGVRLSLGEANQFDVKRANLLQQLSSASVTGQQREDLEKQLAYVPEEKRAYRDAQNLQRQSDITNQNFSGTRELAKRFAALSVDPEAKISTNQKARVEAIVIELNARVASAGEATLTTGEGQKEDVDYIKNIVQDLIKIKFSGNEQDYIKVMGTDNEKLIHALGQQTDLLARILDAVSNGESSYEDVLKDIGADAYSRADRRTISQREAADDKMYIGMMTAAKSGGQIGTMIKGSGTGTSDSISTVVPAGSFVVQAKYANKAKNTINGLAHGGIPVNISNGELLLSPNEVQSIGGYKTAHALNNGQDYAAGGEVKDYRPHILSDMLSGESTADYFSRADKLQLEYDTRKASWDYDQLGGIKKRFAKKPKGYSSSKDDVQQQEYIKEQLELLKQTAVNGLDLEGGVKAIKGQSSRDAMLAELAKPLLFGGIADMAGEGIKELEKFRLGRADKATSGGLLSLLGNSILQGGAATLELGARASKSLVLDPIDLGEKVVKYTAEHGLEETKNVGMDMLSGAGSYIKNMDLDQVKALGVSFKDKFLEDTSKGGLGTTSTILEALSGVGISKAIKGSNIGANIKNTYKSSILSDQTGAVDWGKTGLDITNDVNKKGLGTTSPSEIRGTKLKGYLSEANSINSTDLNIDKYAKEILKDKALLNAVIDRGNTTFGGDRSLAEIITLTGPAGIKGMVTDLVRPTLTKGTKLKGYLSEATDVIGPDVDMNKYAKAISKDKSLLDAVIERGNSAFGGDRSLAEIITLTGPTGIQGMVTDLVRPTLTKGTKLKGYNIGGTVTGDQVPDAIQEDLMPLWEKAAKKDLGAKRALRSYKKDVEWYESTPRFSEAELKSRKMIRSSGVMTARKAADLNNMQVTAMDAKDWEVYLRGYTKTVGVKESDKEIASGSSTYLSKNIDSWYRVAAANKAEKEGTSLEGKTDAEIIQSLTQEEQLQTQVKVMTHGNTLLADLKNKATGASGKEKSNYFARMDALAREMGSNRLKKQRKKQALDDNYGKKRTNYVPMHKSWIIPRIGVGKDQQKAIDDGRIFQKEGQWYVDNRLAIKWRDSQKFISKGRGEELMRADRENYMVKKPTMSSGELMVSEILKLTAGAQASSVLTPMFMSGFKSVKDKVVSAVDLLKGLGNSAKGSKHTGGMVGSTGNYFLERGELVVSKNFKNGGAVSESFRNFAGGGAVEAMNIPAPTTIDTSIIEQAIKSALEAVELKVEDKKIGIDVGDAKVGVDVGDSKVPIDVNDAKVSVDLEGVSVPIDVEGVSIPIDIDNAIIKVDVGNAVVPVEMPEGSIQIDTSSLDESINKLASISIDTNNNVGAEKGDKLAGVLDELSSQILNLKETHAADIEMVNSKILPQGSDPRIDAIIEQSQLDNADLVRQINEVSNKTSSITSTIDLRFVNVKNDINSLNNAVNTVATKVYSVSAINGISNVG